MVIVREMSKPAKKLLLCKTGGKRIAAQVNSSRLKIFIVASGKNSAGNETFLRGLLIIFVSTS